MPAAMCARSCNAELAAYKHQCADRMRLSRPCCYQVVVRSNCSLHACLMHAKGILVKMFKDVLLWDIACAGSKGAVHRSWRRNAPCAC